MAQILERSNSQNSICPFPYRQILRQVVLLTAIRSADSVLTSMLENHHPILSHRHARDTRQHLNTLFRLYSEMIDRLKYVAGHSSRKQQQTIARMVPYWKIIDQYRARGSNARHTEWHSGSSDIWSNHSRRKSRVGCQPESAVLVHWEGCWGRTWWNGVKQDSLWVCVLSHWLSLRRNLTGRQFRCRCRKVNLKMIRSRKQLIKVSHPKKHIYIR